MNNENVIKNFLENKQAKTPLRTIVNGYYSYKGRTLWTRDNELINYNTRIAYIEESALPKSITVLVFAGKATLSSWKAPAMVSTSTEGMTPCLT